MGTNLALKSDEVGATIPIEVVKSSILAPVVMDVKDIYVWKMGRGFQLSKREWCIAETFLKVRNYRECMMVVNKECNSDLSISTVRRWLERPHIKEWLGEQMEERGLMAGWTEGRWLKVVTDHIKGVKRLMVGDLYAMNLIAKVRGFEGGSSLISNNVQINFTQKNGES